MKTLDAIKSRKSIRAYTNKDISNQTVKNLIQIAGKTPSYASTQPWKVYVAKGRKLKQLKALWQRRLSKSSDLYASGSGNGTNSDISGPSKQALKNMPDFTKNTQEWLDHRLKVTGISNQQYRDLSGRQVPTFYGAPVVVYLCVSQYASKYSYYDLGAFGQTLMLAAKDQEIDSLAAYTNVMFGDILHQNLNIPDDLKIVIGICLGYEEKNNLLNKPRAQHLSTDQYLKIIS